MMLKESHSFANFRPLVSQELVLGRFQMVQMGNLIATLGVTLIAASGAFGQSAAAFRGAAPLVPLANEPPPKLIVDPPLPEPLSHGRVVIQYRTDNLHIVPVYGPAALAVSPRIGHLHLTLDDLPWHWVDASNEPLTVVGLPAGPHKIRVDLANANHMVLDTQVVTFVVPKIK
jgi:hypothetical protein